MSELPQLVAFARQLNRLKDTPNEFNKALTLFEASVKSEDTKSLGKQLTLYFEDAQNKLLDNDRVKAIIELAIG